MPNTLVDQTVRPENDTSPYSEEAALFELIVEAREQASLLGSPDLSNTEEEKNSRLM